MCVIEVRKALNEMTHCVRSMRTRREIEVCQEVNGRVGLMEKEGTG